MTGKEYADKEYSNLDEGVKGIIAKSFDTGKGDIADLKANCDYILESKDLEIKTLGERCNQLLKDKGDLTDQIADIKANCDLAIEGREVKIMELEKEIEKHKWNNIFLEDCAGYDKKIAEEYTTLQERIEKLEKENAEQKAEQKYKEHLADPNYFENSEEESYYTGFLDGYHDCQKEHEWHYVKDGDLPKAYQKCYFIYSNSYGEDNKVVFSKYNINVLTGIYAFFLDEETGEETTDPCFYDDINDDEIGLEEVYAWKEIVLPELKESE